MPCQTVLSRARCATTCALTMAALPPLFRVLLGALRKVDSVPGHPAHPGACPERSRRVPSGSSFRWDLIRVSLRRYASGGATVTYSQNKQGHKDALVPNRIRAQSGDAPAPALLLLHRFDVMSKVHHALLHLTFVSTADTPKQRSPHRHLLRSVRGKSSFAANAGRDFQRGILASVGLAQQGKVGGRNLQRAGCRSAAFAVRSMANSTVGRVHFLAGCG